MMVNDALAALAAQRTVFLRKGDNGQPIWLISVTTNDRMCDRPSLSAIMAERGVLYQRTRAGGSGGTCDLHGQYVNQSIRPRHHNL